jgi:beta-galactosidase
MTPKLGVCYYPEHWPETQWAQDARQMRELGLSWVRIGEFAWSRIEPRPGVFDWNWLDRAVDVLGKAGLSIVLSTPTATPPRWMIDKYPDMLAAGADGQPRGFGSRRHYCFSHAPYRQESVRIARLMGERYGQNPHIKAWQIDNEYGCHDTVLSYSAAACAAFRLWLEEKYGSIEALNTAWGNVFWSMEYQNFEQLDLPNQTVTEPNPAHVMDFRRFSSDQVARFNRAQSMALRKTTDLPLIHNYMGRITEFDHFKTGQDLDIASWDSYPLGFLEDRSDQGEDFKHRYMRCGDPDFQAFHHDLYRAVGRGRWWVMEQQPGPVNWAPYNPAPTGGMVRLWTWEAIAHGAEVVSYFRWRQAPFGQEQMHSGLQRPDGSWAEGAQQASEAAKEITALLQNGADISPRPSAAAIIFDYASAWAWETQPQGAGFDYFRLIYDVYRGLRRLGLSVDILPPDTDDFGDRKLVCIPGLFAWTPALQRAISTFKGHILAGPRTGSKTQEFKTPPALPPGLQNFSCKITAAETLRPSAPLGLEKGGAFHIWREWAETSEEVTETCADGRPALISKGNINYLTGWPDDEAMRRMLAAICTVAKLSTSVMKGGERLRDFGDFQARINYDTRDVQIIKR